MNKDYEIIKEDLAALGIAKGDTLLVHSSFRSLGSVDGRIETLLNAIFSVIGDSGTLLVPTLSYTTVSVNNPVFDYLNTPSCTGAVTEYVRVMNGSVRSIHPTHSVTAIGRLAEFYTSGHEKDRTPCGENSPFTKNIYNGGKILILGCNPAYNTTFHAIEEIAKTNYCLNPVALTHTIILPDKTYTGDYHRHNIVQSGYAQRYNRIVDMDNNGMKKGIVHGAESYLFSSEVMTKRALLAMEKDETYFVERMNKD